MGRRHPRPTSWAFPLTRLGTIMISSPRKPQERKEYVAECVVGALADPSCPLWESDRSTSSTISTISTVAFPLSEELVAGRGMSRATSFTGSAPSSCASLSGSVTTEEPRADSQSRHSPSVRHVQFGVANVRVYPQVLGDHPYCSEGCPLELSWEFDHEETHSADDFGNGQNQWCQKLTAEERLAIVKPHCSEAEVRKACRRRNRDITEGRQGLHRQQKRLQKEFFCAESTM
jgi:hypothetical protein